MGSGSTEAILEIINWRSLVHFCCWYVNLIGEFGHEFGQVSNTLITNSLVNLIFWVQFRNQAALLVTWSAFSPSTLTFRVGIPVKVYNFIVHELLENQEKKNSPEMAI